MSARQKAYVLLATEWQAVEFDLVIVRRAIQTLAAGRGLLEGAATTADTIGSFLETISPLALLQQASSFLVDKSAIGEAVLGILTGLNQDLAELYLFVPLQNYRQRSFTSLMDLFVRSIEYRHFNRIGSSIPGVTSRDEVFTPPSQPDLERLNGVDLGIGSLSAFTGFALVATADGVDDYEEVATFYRNFFLSTVPSPGILDGPLPKVYSWGNLITPITVPTGQLFDPVWELIRGLERLENLSRGARNAQEKLQKLGTDLKAQAAELRAIAALLRQIESLLAPLTARTHAAITFVNQSIDELRDCLLNSPNAPTQGRYAAGAIGLVSDPGVIDFIQAVL